MTAKTPISPPSLQQKVVIVGGGAGGLILATRLAKKTRGTRQCNVTLVDESLTHIWKPLLHEIAAGSLNSYEDELGYLTHAAKHHYEFQLGRLEKLNRVNKTLSLAAVVDASGQIIIPPRQLSYDILILAVGSVSNDFAIPGVAEHCLILDSRKQAERFHTRFLGLYLAAHADKRTEVEPAELLINIIGAGATGIELASELHSTLTKMERYGLDEIHPTQVKIRLIEAGPSILSGQSSKMIAEASQALSKMGIEIKLNTRVHEVGANFISVNDRETLPSSLSVWTTGIKAPEFLNALDGLETNKINQLVVKSNLQTTRDEDIYALGDCAEVTLNGKRLAPRAQVAQQQAVFLTNNLRKRFEHKPEDAFVFNDKGAFVSLGDNNSVGTVFGRVFGAVNMQGMLAKWAYVMLYRKHQLELLGFYQTAVLVIKDLLTRAIGPRIKLH